MPNPAASCRTNLNKDALRKDMPVYLYDEGVQYPIKVSSKLKKEGFKEVYILKGGYSAWEGKKKGTKVSSDK